jgi:anhydro-N-acetylmuramic acid kinase
MLEKLLELRKKETKVIVGLMSGTSADGVDVAVVEVKGNGKGTKIKTIGWRTFPFEKDLKWFDIEKLST